MLTQKFKTYKKINNNSLMCVFRISASTNVILQITIFQRSAAGLELSSFIVVKKDRLWRTRRESTWDMMRQS